MDCFALRLSEIKSFTPTSPCEQGEEQRGAKAIRTFALLPPLFTGEGWGGVALDLPLSKIKSSPPPNLPASRERSKGDAQNRPSRSISHPQDTPKTRRRAIWTEHRQHVDRANENAARDTSLPMETGFFRPNLYAYTDRKSVV